MTDLTPVTSTLINGVAYNPGKEELTVQFHNGKEYVYASVPPAVYNALMDAKSAGAFFINQIKGKYEVSKK